MRQADLKTKPFSETTELESSRIFGPLPRSPKVPVPPPSCVCSGGVQGARLCPVSAAAGCRVPASTSLQKQRGAGRPPPSCVRRGRVQGARVLVPSGPVVPAGLSGQSGDFNRNAGFSTGGWISRSRRRHVLCLVSSPFLVTSRLPSHLLGSPLTRALTPFTRPALPGPHPPPQSHLLIQSRRVLGLKTQTCRGPRGSDCRRNGAETPGPHLTPSPSTTVRPSPAWTSHHPTCPPCQQQGE